MRIIKGFIWKAVQQYSTYFIKLIFQIVLARILSASEFGLVAEMLVYIAVAEAFANGGFGTALTQKKNADSDDFATTTIAGLAISIFLYVVIFIAAPYIGNYYGEPELPKLLRIYGIAIPFCTVGSIQNAYVIKRFETKKLFVCSFISNLLAGVFAIILAYAGYGALSLVVQSVMSSVLSVVILQFLIRSRLKIAFSAHSFKTLFAFSWKLVLSGVLGNIIENMYNLIIGKHYGTETLGYYNRGNSFPNMIVGQLRSAVGAMTLPLFSNLQEDKRKLFASVKLATHLSVLIMFPMATGLAAVAEPLISLLLGDKWLPCLFFLRVECIFYGMLPIASSLSNALISIGRSKLALIVECIKLALSIVVVMFAKNITVELLCVIRCAISIVIIVIMTICSQRLIGYGLTELIKDIRGPLVLSVVMGATVYGVLTLMPFNNLLKLALGIILGVGVYGVGCIIFMREDWVMIKSWVVRVFNGNE